MRMLALVCLLALAGCVGSARVEGFGATGPASFQYSAHTNTVMTANDDGTAERLRRDWIADALKVHAMCPDGYVVDTRHFAPDAEGPFGNGGEIAVIEVSEVTVNEGAGISPKTTRDTPAKPVPVIFTDVPPPSANTCGRTPVTAGAACCGADTCQTSASPGAGRASVTRLPAWKPPCRAR